ncbi:two-component sensor histidine kinase [Streptomyces spiroverticillatus]|uniref:histidine kinase n=2 Tax=Streptomyces finlayi TaxID=67296 RepID=A0A918X2P7_9ACTN|nr:two-component sensor histidine kinase [Streptomyces spiroverticillatus]GHD04725.1 two-component sensor histidine kinase [Streptomyces finlayi]
MTGERTRLTALYAGLLVLSGATLIGVVYLLVRQGINGQIGKAVTQVISASDVAAYRPGHTVPMHPADPSRPGDPPVLSPDQLVNSAAQAALGRLLTVSLLTLAAFVLLSVVLAWWLAGRVLRPVDVITETARRLSGSNLDQRIALDAPPGELKRLADTFDEMLGRIEQLVTAQRRFAANAAHELRTPLALQRAAAEIGLAGEPDAERVRTIRQKLIELSDDSAQTIESLLTLARAEQGLDAPEPVALHTLAASAALATEAEAQERGIALDLDLRPLQVDGDPVLLTRLLHNLLANALRYNHRDGRVTLSTAPDGTLTVSNTGPVVPAESAPRLFEPFHRLQPRRHSPTEGVGLGLALVASIARAHGAQAHAEPNPDGGLTVRVMFHVKR